VARPTVIETAPPGFSPTINDLVGVARGAGRADAKPRTIRYWRSLGLISPPVRYGREYRYPLAALAEVDGLARWGRRNTDHDLLRFARYIEAGTVDPHDALDACAAAFERFRHGAEEAASLAQEGEDTVRAEAEKAAKARGKGALLPRRVRMSGAERTTAFRHLFNEALDLNVDASERDVGQFQLERSIGLRSGRGGATRDVSDLMMPVEEWRVDPDAATDAIRTASPEAAELGRRAVETNCIWLPAVIPLFAAESRPHETPFLDVVETAFEELGPDIYVVLFVSRLRRFNQRSRSELAAQLDEFQPAELIAELLADWSDTDLRIVRSRLRLYQLAQLAIARRASH
jgi:hypothetical protein